MVLFHAPDATMGHLFFLALHIFIIAIPAFGALAITIPLHLIYSAIHDNRPRAEARPNRWTHVHCPDCRELVPKGANLCRFCGCRLIPAHWDASLPGHRADSSSTIRSSAQE